MAGYTVGDIALVTQKDGRQYVGVYTLAPGIDYYWRPVVPGTGGNQLANPDISATMIGRAPDYLEWLDDMLCDALTAAQSGKYDGLSVEAHLKHLIERIRTT